MRTISKFSKLELQRGLPESKFEKDRSWEACIQGKHVNSSFKPIYMISTQRPLELLHMDLFGPTNHASLSGMRYGFVIFDD